MSAWLSSTKRVLGVSASIAPSLGGKHLIIMRAQVQASLLPSGEVVGHSDGAAAGPRGHAVGDVLPEGGCPGDGRLVDLLMLPDIVRTSVALKSAELLALGRALAIVCILLNIVLDQGVSGPSVDGNEDRA